MSADQFKDKGKEEVEKLVEVSDQEDSTYKSNYEESSDKVGKVIAKHYEVQNCIGKGGMSAVYKAHHKLLDKTVAIKFILPRLMHDEKTVKRFKQEAKAAAELEHQNICSVKEFGIDDEGSPFIVMEFVEGISLRDEVESNGPLEETRAMAIMEEVCEGIKHAHARGVIHRDLKPANIILVKGDDGSESVRIVDFGIAKLTRDDEVGNDLTQTGEIFGTPNYMSPEQCLGKKVDTKSDIYSLGCVFYFLISGKAPFESASTLQTLMSHVNEKIDHLDSVSSSVNNIIRKATAKSPSARYRLIKNFKNDVSSAAKGMTIELPAKESSYTRNTSQQQSSSSSPDNKAEQDGLTESNAKEKPGEASNTVEKLSKQQMTVVAAFLILFLFLNLITSVIAEKQNPKHQKIRKSKSINHRQNLNNVSTLRSKKPWTLKHEEGDKAHREGNSELAYQLFLEARKLAEDGKAFTIELAYINEEIGACARYLNKNKEAAEAFQKAAAYRKEANDLDRYQKNLGAQARSEVADKNFKTGLALYEKVLAMQKNRFKNHPVLISYEEKTGRAYFDAGEYQKSAEHFQKAFQISKSFPGQYQKDLALAHWYYAKCQSKLKGNKNEITKHFELAKKIGRLAWLEDDILSKIDNEHQNFVNNSSK